MARAPMLSLLVAVAALLAGATASPATRVAGGVPVTAQAYPYVVNLQYHFLSAWWSHQCGGTLITSRIVLSSSHCFDESAPSEWRARVGSTAAAGDGTVVPVQRFVLHELFDRATNDYDVAIVILSQAAPLSATVGTALIPSPLYILPDGAIVSALGWGELWEGGPNAQTLQLAPSALLSQSDCAARMSSAGRVVTERMLCATGLVAGAGACVADWGGPLIFDSPQGPVVVGIMSWTVRCGEAFVSARGSELSDWILANAVV